MARRKRRQDPYADQSSAPEDEAINSQIRKSWISLDLLNYLPDM